MTGGTALPPRKVPSSRYSWGRSPAAHMQVCECTPKYSRLAEGPGRAGDAGSPAAQAGSGPHPALPLPGATAEPRGLWQEQGPGPRGEGRNMLCIVVAMGLRAWARPRGGGAGSDGGCPTWPRPPAPTRAALTGVVPKHSCGRPGWFEVGGAGHGQGREQWVQGPCGVCQTGEGGSRAPPGPPGRPGSALLGPAAGRE